LSAPGSRWAKCTAAATIDEGHVPDDLGITRNVGLAAHLVKDRVPIDRFTRLHYMPYPRGVPRLNASLPELGAWDGWVYGELGVLVVDGDRLVCHACGELFRGLGYHAVRAHQLTADAYRAVFGLRASTSLIGPALKARRREIARDTLAQFGGRYSGIAGLSFEERSRLMGERRLRLESLRDPNRQAIFARRTARVRERVAVGELPQPGAYPRTERHRHPAAVKDQIGAAHRGRVHHYGPDGDVAARIAVLDPAVLAKLDPLHRTVRELRYGRGPDGRHLTYAALERHLGLTRKVLARLLREAWMLVSEQG